MLKADREFLFFNYQIQMAGKGSNFIGIQKQIIKNVNIYC